MKKRICLFALSMIIVVGVFHNTHARQTSNIIVLLHGLARTDSSFGKMEKSLQEDGYIVCNIHYPSTAHPVETLVAKFVLPEIKRCTAGTTNAVNFVTHSMGGILVRYIASQERKFDIGRVVMLSPPNKGSEVVDKLGGLWLFEVINGPAGLQLGTDSKSLPNSLGPANFELGVITGNKSINWILSGMIKGVDDGKVSIESAKLEGMNDFLVVEATHPFIMKNDVVIEQTKHFFINGKFNRPIK